MDVITVGALEGTEINANEHKGEADEDGPELEMNAGLRAGIDHRHADRPDENADGGKQRINRLMGHVDAAVRRLGTGMLLVFLFDLVLVMLLIPPGIAGV